MSCNYDGNDDDDDDDDDDNDDNDNEDNDNTRNHEEVSGDREGAIILQRQKID